MNPAMVTIRDDATGRVHRRVRATLEGRLFSPEACTETVVSYVHVNRAELAETDLGAFCRDCFSATDAAAATLQPESAA